MLAMRMLKRLGVLSVLMIAACADTAADDSGESSAAGLQGFVAPDVLVQWNAITSATLGENLPSPLPCGDPTGNFRPYALTAVAVYDAVNSISRRYEPWGGVMVKGYRNADPSAAAASAAHGALVRVCPQLTAQLDSQLATTLAAIPNGHAKSKGVELGDKVAEQIVAIRANDGNSVANLPNYTPPSLDPGVFRSVEHPFPNSHVQYVGLGAVTPWALQSSAQFHANPPPALDSGYYAESYNETKAYGKSDSTFRTPDQTLIGRWWRESSIWTLNRFARAALQWHPMDIYDAARMFAHLSMSVSDAFIADYESKYTYLAWRPVDAIRNGDVDGNPLTAGDPTWLPLGQGSDAQMGTPNTPEYPSAHCANTGAGTWVLIHYFGDRFPAPLTLTNVIGSQTFTSFSQAKDRLVDARIYLGIHFRFADEEGVRLGQQVANYDLETSLQERHEQGGHDDDD